VKYADTSGGFSEKVKGKGSPLVVQAKGARSKKKKGGQRFRQGNSSHKGGKTSSEKRKKKSHPMTEAVQGKIKKGTAPDDPK